MYLLVLRVLFHQDWSLFIRTKFRLLRQFPTKCTAFPSELVKVEKMTIKISRKLQSLIIKYFLQISFFFSRKVFKKVYETYGKVNVWFYHFLIFVMTPIFHHHLFCKFRKLFCNYYANSQLYFLKFWKKIGKKMAHCYTFSKFLWHFIFFYTFFKLYL